MYAMTADEARCMLQANEMVWNTIANAVKEYWEENHEIITAGICAMNGNYYMPVNNR